MLGAEVVAVEHHGAARRAVAGAEGADDGLAAQDLQAGLRLAVGGGDGKGVVARCQRGQDEAEIAVAPGLGGRGVAGNGELSGQGAEVAPGEAEAIARHAFEQGLRNARRSFDDAAGDAIQRGGQFGEVAGDAESTVMDADSWGGIADGDLLSGAGGEAEAGARLNAVRGRSGHGSGQGFLAEVLQGVGAVDGLVGRDDAEVLGGGGEEEVGGGEFGDEGIVTVVVVAVVGVIPGDDVGVGGGGGEVARIGLTRNIGITRAIDRDAVAFIVVAAAEVGGIPHRLAVGAELEHEGIEVSPWRFRIFCVDRGEVVRCGSSRDMGIARAIDRDAGPYIPSPTAAKIGGIVHGLAVGAELEYEGIFIIATP